MCNRLSRFYLTPRRQTKRPWCRRGPCQRRSVRDRIHQTRRRSPFGAPAGEVPTGGRRWRVLPNLRRRSRPSSSSYSSLATTTSSTNAIRRSCRRNCRRHHRRCRRRWRRGRRTSRSSHLPSRRRLNLPATPAKGSDGSSSKKRQLCRLAGGGAGGRGGRMIPKRMP